MESALVVYVLTMLGTAACSDATRPPASGSIRVTAVTVGDDLDPNGYVVTVDGGTRHVVGTRSPVDISAIAAGDHTVRLDGTSTNCTVQGEAEQRVNVLAGRPTLVSFTIACVPRVGSIAVSTVTTGVDVQTRSYTIAVNAESGQPIGVNDATTLQGVREGVQNVWLRDIADNCTVSSSNPQQVAVSFDQSATAAFSITCVSTKATLRITTVTTGPDTDPDGYSVRIAPYETTTASVPTNGTTSVTVTAHKGYVVWLEGVAGNCSVDQQGWQGSTRQVDLAPGWTTTVSFAIACEALPDKRLPPGGQLAFVRDGKIHRINTDGTGLVRLTEGPNDASPAWSPDGKRIAFSRVTGRNEWGVDVRAIFVANADGSNIVQRTSAGYNGGPAWSPDGKHLAFDCFSPNTGSSEVCVMSADDDGKAAKAIAERTGYDGQPAWSPDGSRIAFVSDWVFYDGAADIFVMNADGSSITQLTNGMSEPAPGLLFFHPAWSPDGYKLAVSRCPFAFDTCGTSNLVVMNADGTGSTTLTTTGVASAPAWSRDGRTIAFGTRIGIEWISADGSQRGLIVADGWSPSWRP